MHDTQGLVEAAKVAPPVTVAGASMLGLPIADWVTILTVLYLILQMVLLLPKYYELYLKWRVKCRSKRGS